VPPQRTVMGRVMMQQTTRFNIVDAGQHACTLAWPVDAVMRSCRAEPDMMKGCGW